MKLRDKILEWWLALFRPPVNHSRNDEIDVMRLKVLTAMISPSYRGLYFFQQDFLPRKFYGMGNEFIKLIEDNLFFQLVEEFNQGENMTLLNKNNTDVFIHRYTNNKVIIHIHIPDLSNVKIVQTETLLSKSVFLCFDKDDSTRNYYYTAEINEDSSSNRYHLCGTSKDKAHSSFVYSPTDEGLIINDIPLKEIESRFGAVK